MKGAGELVVVGTPLGNTADLSPRALEALGSADVVCCEDTRRSGLLFARLGVRPRRLLSLHGHNEARRIPELVALLEAGGRVAVVSDAGMPAVSDPGSRLAAAAHEAGARVTVVPGPSAATAAVAVAGFGGDRFLVEGFLPRRGPERRRRLAAMAAASCPVVIFEAPGRVDALLAELVTACGGERRVAVCRELTKLHEETWRGPVADAVGRWPGDRAKGEFAVVLEAAPPEGPPAANEDIASAVDGLVRGGLSRRDAVAEIAERTGIARRQVYEALGRPAGASPRPGGL